MPMVSVIIPAYNAESYIAETIESALCQTYQDIEILVVDDGSTDGTQRVLEDYTDRVRIFDKANGGPASARNVGIKHAEGEYVAFLDSDDVWLPHKLERQMACFGESPQRGLVHTAMTYFDDAGQKPDTLRLVEGNLRSEDAFSHLFVRNFVGNSTVVVRKVCFDRVGFFDESLEFLGTEDYEMWLRVAYCYPFGYVPDPLTRYRLRQGQLSSKIEKAYQNERHVIEKAVRLFPDLNERVGISVAMRLSRLALEYGTDYFAVGELNHARSKFRESLNQQWTTQAFAYYLSTFLGGSLNLLRVLRRRNR